MKVSLLLLLVASVASADFVDEPIDGKDVGEVPGVEGEGQNMQEAGFSQVIALPKDYWSEKVSKFDKVDDKYFVDIH